jgi:hypothetical protein
MSSRLSRGWPCLAVVLVGTVALACSGRSSVNGPGGVHSGGAGGTGASGGTGAVGTTGGSGGSSGRIATGSGGSPTAGTGGNTEEAGRGASSGSGASVGGSSAGQSARGGSTSGAGRGGNAGRAQGGNRASAGGSATGGSATGGNHATGGDAGDQGTAGEGTDCDLSSVCGRGTCWEGLNGFSGCVNPKQPPPPADCFDATDCCTSNADCTAGSDGLCIPRATTVLSCGGAYPAGNTCNYDTCAEDEDCYAAKPADSTVATCLPRGALGQYTATCAYGACRTDNDCTQGEGGQCLYGLAATHGGCDLRYVLYCAYANDPCTDRYASCGDTTKVCAPNDDFQGRHCVAAPPMYP